MLIVDLLVMNPAIEKDGMTHEKSCQCVYSSAYKSLFIQYHTFLHAYMCSYECRKSSRSILAQSYYENIII